MELATIDSKIASLREAETRARAEIARLMLERDRVCGKRNARARVVPIREGIPSINDTMGGWDAHKGNVQVAIRAALDRLYASRGISRIGGVAA